MTTATSMTAKRRQLVEDQLIARGIADPRILAAMGKVPRELFVPPIRREWAYEDRPLAIPAAQTISQPYIVAFMIEALRLTGSEKVLEIGAGSGYAAAVLAEVASEVFAIERIGELVEFARANLQATGYTRVHLRHADGTQGWQDEAPFDAILVSAGAPDEPKTLMHQLKIGGRLVVPIGADPSNQELIRITRTGEDSFTREDLTSVRFVPLIGSEGWKDGVE